MSHWRTSDQTHCQASEEGLKYFYRFLLLWKSSLRIINSMTLCIWAKHTAQPTVSQPGSNGKHHTARLWCIGSHQRAVSSTSCCSRATNPNTLSLTHTQLLSVTHTVYPTTVNPNAARFLTKSVEHFQKNKSVKSGKQSVALILL